LQIKVRVATILLSRADPPLGSAEFSTFVPEGTDVEGLVRGLGIPAKLVGSVTVNKRRSPVDRELADGDLVAIIPAISGG
jgi:molybdopterin converting factor small subunit